MDVECKNSPKAKTKTNQSSMFCKSLIDSLCLSHRKKIANSSSFIHSLSKNNLIHAIFRDKKI